MKAPDRQSRSLVCSCIGVEDARMTSIKRERSSGVKISQELMNALFSKLSRFMSIVL